jgi:hypothetical protein
MQFIKLFKITIQLWKFLDFIGSHDFHTWDSCCVPAITFRKKIMWRGCEQARCFVKQEDYNHEEEGVKINVRAVYQLVLYRKKTW